VRLSDLLFDPPHSLARQSWAPRDMRGGGTINADGFGVVWYDTATGHPVRYRRDRPLWSDADLPALAGAVRAGAVLAAVRSATVGMPVTAAWPSNLATPRWRPVLPLKSGAPKLRRNRPIKTRRRPHFSP